jgi:hypothetical protein
MRVGREFLRNRVEPVGGDGAFMCAGEDCLREETIQHRVDLRL